MKHFLYFLLTIVCVLFSLLLILLLNTELIGTRPQVDTVIFVTNSTFSCETGNFKEEKDKNLLMVMTPEKSGDISAGLEFYRDIYFISLPHSNKIDNYKTDAERIVWRTAEYYSFKDKPWCNGQEKGITGEISLLPKNIVSLHFSNWDTPRKKRGGRLVRINGQHSFIKMTVQELQQKYDFFDPDYEYQQ